VLFSTGEDKERCRTGTAVTGRAPVLPEGAAERRLKGKGKEVTRTQGTA